MQNMFQKLVALQEKAYAPYSHYHVAAIVVAEDGKEYAGVNVENAAYPLTVCAERNAVANMVVAGSRKITAVYLLAGKQEKCSSPCGACRQVLYEMAASPETKVYVFNYKGAYEEYTIAKLLPNAWDF